MEGIDSSHQGKPLLIITGSNVSRPDVSARLTQPCPNTSAKARRSGEYIGTVEIQMQVQMYREAPEAVPYKMHVVQARIEPSRHPNIVQCAMPLVQIAIYDTL